MKRKSFTLIEILVSIGIISLILFIIVSVILSILHFSYKMSLQRQVNREARNIMEMLAREGRLARGTAGAGTINVTTPERASVREVPKFGKTFYLEDSKLKIATDIYDVTVTESEVYDPADIMLVLDRTGSMLSKADESSPATDCYNVNNLGIKVPEGENFQKVACSDMSDGDGNGYPDMLERTKLFTSTQTAISFIEHFKAINEASEGANPYRIGLITYAGKDPVSRVTGYSSQLTDSLGNLLLLPTLDLNNLRTAGKTNIYDSFQRGIRTLDTTTFDDSWSAEYAGQPTGARDPATPQLKKVTILLTDGRANSPRIDFILRGQPQGDYPMCDGSGSEVSKNFPMPYHDPTNFDLICGYYEFWNPDGTGCDMCNIYARDIAWQYAKNLQGSTSDILFTIGFGDPATLDDNLLQAMAGFVNGRYENGQSPERINDIFMEIAEYLSSKTVTAERSETKSPGTQTVISSNIDLASLNFTSQTLQPSLGIIANFVSQDYDEPNVPSWQKASIEINTFFTTRNYQ